MSSTRSGPRELAESVGTKARELAGKLRRMIVSRASGAIWQIIDHDLSILGGDERPTKNAEVFAGVGFTSRPSSSGDVEAIIAFPGGPGNPIIIATRQEAVRRVIAADLAADETQIHNSQTIIRIMADGTVEIRTSGGTAGSVATKADLQTLRDALSTAAIAIGVGGAAAVVAAMDLAVSTATPPTNTTDVQWPIGTEVLKAE